jgi:putative hydrolase of the HAD superfamily
MDDAEPLPQEFRQAGVVGLGVGVPQAGITGRLPLRRMRVIWVMFDYGCVVSHPPTDRHLARMAAAAEAAAPAFADAYWQWRRAYDQDELDADEYWRQVGRSLGRSYGDGEVAELTRLDLAGWLRLQAGTVALIEDLAAAGWPLALLSNAPGDLADAIRRLPIAAQFRHLIFSYELKATKPDPECYGAALARIGARADEVVFVDDRSENVAAAAALGLRSVQFTSPAQARTAVAEALAAGV